MDDNFERFVDIFTYREHALNFTFTRKQEEGIFYAHIMDKDKDGTLMYWVIETTNEMILNAKLGIIDTYTFMTSPIGLQEVTIDTFNGISVVMDLECALMLYEAELPDYDITLIPQHFENN